MLVGRFWYLLWDSWSISFGSWPKTCSRKTFTVLLIWQIVSSCCVITVLCASNLRNKRMIKLINSVIKWKMTHKILFVLCWITVVVGLWYILHWRGWHLVVWGVLGWVGGAPLIQFHTAHGEYISIVTRKHFFGNRNFELLQSLVGVQPLLCEIHEMTNTEVISHINKLFVTVFFVYYIYIYFVLNAIFLST